MTAQTQRKRSQEENRQSDQGKDAPDNYQGRSSSAITSYIMTADESEIARLQDQHELNKLARDGKLFHSPMEEQLKKGIDVLDSGCGPGSWILEMSKLYSKSTFYGFDLSTMFSVHYEKKTKPANCHFQVANVLEPLPYPDNCFDFVHQRFLGIVIPQQRWPLVLNSLIRVLKPGGWLELTEFSDCVNIGPKGSLLRKLWEDQAAQQDIRISATRELELHMINAGLFNIEVVSVLMPVGNHGSDNSYSKLSTQNLINLYHTNSFRQIVAQRYPELKSDETYDKFINDVLDECRKRKVTTVCLSFYGQKP